MQYQQQPANSGGKGCLEACLACDKSLARLSILAMHAIPPALPAALPPSAYACGQSWHPAQCMAPAPEGFIFCGVREPH